MEGWREKQNTPEGIIPHYIFLIKGTEFNFTWYTEKGTRNESKGNVEPHINVSSL